MNFKIGDRINIKETLEASETYDAMVLYGDKKVRAGWIEATEVGTWKVVAEQENFYMVTNNFGESFVICEIATVTV